MEERVSCLLLRAEALEGRGAQWLTSALAPALARAKPRRSESPPPLLDFMTARDSLTSRQPTGCRSRASRTADRYTRFQTFVRPPERLCTDASPLSAV